MNSNYLFRGVLKTRPMTTNIDAETTLYCALGRVNCRAFITAAKSFLQYYSNSSVVVQDDGSLDKKCIDEIRKHIIGVKIYSRDDMMEVIFSSANSRLRRLIPPVKEYNRQTSVKIMYLKFLNVIFRLNGEKVIIIDSDVLFLQRPDEIIQWAEEPYQRDFYGEGANAKSNAFYEMGFTFQSLDIANFSSGTIGVGGAVTQEELIDIFERIYRYDSSLFEAWEIEQALWAVVMAKRDNPINLDWLRDVYIGSGWRTYKELKQKAVIAHFAGAVRFKNFRYLRCAYDIIKKL